MMIAKDSVFELSVEINDGSITADERTQSTLFLQIVMVRSVVYIMTWHTMETRRQMIALTRLRLNLFRLLLTPQSVWALRISSDGLFVIPYNMRQLRLCWTRCWEYLHEGGVAPGNFLRWDRCRRDVSIRRWLSGLHAAVAGASLPTAFRAAKSKALLDLHNTWDALDYIFLDCISSEWEYHLCPGLLTTTLCSRCCWRMRSRRCGSDIVVANVVPSSSSWNIPRTFHFYWVELPYYLTRSFHRWTDTTIRLIYGA